MPTVTIVLFLAAFWAGTQNALAGGGSFVTLPALMLTGLDARAANIASTLALFPGQVTTGWFGRGMVAGTGVLSTRTLVLVSLAGGVVGGLLLLYTPSSFFARLVPWLVLFATGIFTWGSFFRKRSDLPAVRISPPVAGISQFLIAIYGGYFGGGIGFLMLAALTMAGLAVRNAGAMKNILSAIMNAAAAAIFVFAPGIPWGRVAIACAGAMLGGYVGAMLLKRVDERYVRAFVVVVGVALTIGLFVKSP